MAKQDNYQIQADQAREAFLRYDQQALMEKLKLKADEDWLYTRLLSVAYRIHRRTAEIQRLEGEVWVQAHSHSEVMTLLDLLCDSREDRWLTLRWKNMQSFGLMFHQNLLEDQRDSYADRFSEDLEGFRLACEALGGTPLPHGDAAYAIELFDGLCIALQLWLGDEEFPARLRFLWDENALMYLKYETMYFARALLLRRLEKIMQNA